TPAIVEHDLSVCRVGDCHHKTITGRRTRIRLGIHLPGQHGVEGCGEIDGVPCLRYCISPWIDAEVPTAVGMALPVKLVHAKDGVIDKPILKPTGEARLRCQKNGFDHVVSVWPRYSGKLTGKLESCHSLSSGGNYILRWITKNDRIQVYRSAFRSSGAKRK